MTKFSILCLLTAATATTTLAQGNNSEDKTYWGEVHGSFETTTIYYQDDQKSGAMAPETPYGSNNYLNVDYTYGKFSAGLQAEYYPQVLDGYRKEFNGLGLPMKYLTWNDNNFSVTVGDYYEQFGSGLVLRSWEDRYLGLNNSLGGARATFNIADYIFSGKVVYGFPRNYLRSVGQDFGLVENFVNHYSATQVAGADFNLSLSRLLFGDAAYIHDLYVEGSFVGRFENDQTEYFDIAKYSNLGLTNYNLSYSTRLGYAYGGFSLKGEYVGKGEELTFSHKSGEYELAKGNAQLLEINYSQSGFSTAIALRRLENMQNLAYRVNDMSAGALPGNTINYIPALCQQQSYMLASLNPYVSSPAGEMGGQIDLYYNVKRGSKLGGKYGMKLHANASMYYTPDFALSNNHSAPRLAYRDITVDIERKWNKKLKTILFVSIQEQSPTHGEKIATEAQNAFVADIQYNFSQKFSLRTELQYLYSQERSKDWMAALVEANFAPKWSVFASDMYNHGDSKVHYLSVGTAYTYSSLRVALSYGRNREGMVCSGGVCRLQPAYTGANLQLTYLF